MFVIFSNFSKAIILLKKIIYEKPVFKTVEGGGMGELKIPREVIILHAWTTAKIFLNSRKGAFLTIIMVPFIGNCSKTVNPLYRLSSNNVKWN